jgi:hypothetical protein
MRGAVSGQAELEEEGECAGRAYRWNVSISRDATSGWISSTSSRRLSL